MGKETWEDYCQAHLDHCMPLPVRFNPFTHGGAHVFVLPELCPLYLGDTMLLAAERIKQFPTFTTWRNHLSDHSMTGEKQAPGDPNSLRYPHLTLLHLSLPQCEDAFKSTQDVNFHLQNVHCAQFVKAKRSNPAGERSLHSASIEVDLSSYY